MTKRKADRQINRQDLDKEMKKLRISRQDRIQV